MGISADKVQMMHPDSSFSTALRGEAGTSQSTSNTTASMKTADLGLAIMDDMQFKCSDLKGGRSGYPSLCIFKVSREVYQRAGEVYKMFINIYNFSINQA